MISLKAIGKLPLVQVEVIVINYEEMCNVSSNIWGCDLTYDSWTNMADMKNIVLLIDINKL